MHPYKVIGRQKAGTWGKPHRDDAAKAIRAVNKREVHSAMKSSPDEYWFEGQREYWRDSE